MARNLHNSIAASHNEKPMAEHLSRHEAAQLAPLGKIVRKRFRTEQHHRAKTLHRPHKIEWRWETLTGEPQSPWRLWEFVHDPDLAQHRTAARNASHADKLTIGLGSP